MALSDEGAKAPSAHGRFVNRHYIFIILHSQPGVILLQIHLDRQALHRIPELDRNLPKTTEYIKNALSGLKCQVFSPAEGALCAFFDFGKPETIAFRTDMDALPITEKTGLPFASGHAGQMHACGHDGHMAMALELARRVNAKEDLPRNVLLVFQPAEETTGGAKDICDSGVFARYNVTAIFGMHLWPGQKAGEICSRRCEMMSRSCEVKVDITGKSAHIAKSWEGIDAMAAGVEFYSRVVALEQSLPKHIFRLLKFGKLHSGTVGNAVSGYTRLEGSLRAFQDEVFFGLRDGVKAIAKEIEEKTGCTVQVHMNDGYPAILNPDELYDRVLQCASFCQLEAPSMITEDFSWYQRSVPGVFFFLGTGDTPALHADTFDFDEEILLKGAAFFENLAENLP